MSAQHHASPEEIEAQRRMLQEFLGVAKPRFPQGKVSPDDRGEISFAVALDLEKKAVIVRFAKPVDWIGLDRASANRLADLLIDKARYLPKEPSQNRQETSSHE